jgi:pimeloyl-ACP methyl ester carboxylesterase
LVVERTVTSFDGTPIWYSDSFDNGPTVVLLHGVSMTSITNFDVHYGPDADGRMGPLPGPTIASALRDIGARVVGIDARGHGRSGRSSDPDRYRGDSHARDVTAVIDELGVDRFDLVGYSMGSVTAARMLNNEPRLRAVALCGTGRWFLDDTNSQSLQAFHDCGQCFQTNAWNDHPKFRPFRAYARLDPFHDFDSIGAAMIGFDLVARDCVSAAKVPVLVLNGGQDDGDRDAAELAEIIPGAEAVAAGDGNHGTAPSDPDFHSTLITFIKRNWPH